ncbi:MAG: pyruvate dehydrogenase complex dihydrolipoamide acetyltransferase [Pseudomonadota bacterium]
MTINITMPQLSPTMTDGTLSKWLVKEGDSVTSGDVLAEIETDKATMEVESIDEGTVGKILVAEGTDNVPVNNVIAVLLEEGEDASALDGVDTAPAAPAPAAEPAAAEPAAPEAEAPAAAAPAPQPAAAPAPAPAGGGERVKASPLARSMAKQAGIDLTQLTGSGPHGRIVKRDVEAAAAGGVATAASPITATIAAPVMAPGAAYEDVKLSNMRKVIAERLQEAKQTIPHFYLTVDCELDRLLELRKELNGRSDDYKLSVNDFVIKALGVALRKVPDANAAWGGDVLRRFTTVDVSVAVAIDGGLITPIIRNADAKGLVEISEEMKELAGRAREGKLMPEEYQGGTFSLSNLGMFGIKQFDAVINPPQAGIIAVGAGEQRPVVKDGALSVATVMSCTLSCDHRVIDGAVGARLLTAFKGLIEEPLTMLL